MKSLEHWLHFYAGRALHLNHSDKVAEIIAHLERFDPKMTQRLKNDTRNT